MLEIEIKASLAGISVGKLLDRAGALGFEPAGQMRELDLYFNGRDRDFQLTDEALRLRRISRIPHGPQETLLTYKGSKLDQISSTRMEYETVVADGEMVEKILEALGYAPVFKVDKFRREYRLGDVVLCLDEVAKLGTYLELETLVPAEVQQEGAVARMLELLDQLGVPREHMTRDSYLDILLKDGAAPELKC